MSASLVHVRLRCYTIGACVSFLGMAGICSLLYPRVFDHYVYGISTFGSVAKTAALYTVGFIGTILCMALIARELQKHEDTMTLRIGLWLGAIFMTGILITSVGAYSQWHSTYLVHVTFASLLALSQTIISVWAIRQKGVSFVDYALAFSFIAIVAVSLLPLVRDIPGFRSYPLREALAFACAMGLIGRAAFRATQDQ